MGSSRDFSVNGSPIDPYFLPRFPLNRFRKEKKSSMKSYLSHARKSRSAARHLILVSLFLLLMAACGPSESDATTTPEAQPTEVEQENPQATQVPATTATEGEDGYPGPGGGSGYPDPADAEDESGYPGPPSLLPENLLDEPPDPERDLPQADAGRATIGGVLVQEFVDEGFVPLMPVELRLGTIVETTDGEAAFLRTNSSAPSAQLFPTGIFVFRNVEPGTYGLVVDVGYTEFAVREENGEDLLMFTVEPGEVRDLGQVITPLPDS